MFKRNNGWIRCRAEMPVSYPAFFCGATASSQIMMTLTNLVSSFAMGTTILLGQQIGCGERKKGGRTVGTAMRPILRRK